MRIAAPVRARRRPQRLVGGVEVVLGRDDLVAGSQTQAAVQQREAHRRAVGQRDVVGRRSQVRPGGFANAPLEPPLVGVEVLDRVRVEFATVLLDRLADLPWVGREQERREVEEFRLQVEEIANAGPAAEVGDGCTLVGGAARAAKQRRPCDGGAEPEELAPAEASVVIRGLGLAHVDCSFRKPVYAPIEHDRASRRRLHRGRLGRRLCHCG